MEAERLATADRTLVPNRFVVHLNPDDLEGVRRHDRSRSPSELADGALVFARTRRYTLVDRPAGRLLADPSVERADIRVDRPLRRPDRRRTTVAPRPRDARPRRCGPRSGERTSRRRRRSVAVHATRWSSRSRGRAHPRPGCGSSTATATSRSHDVRRVGPDDRSGGRQRPRPRRRPGLAPPRPDLGRRGTLVYTRPRQHERLAGQRRRRSASWSLGRGRPDRARATRVIVVEVAGDVP